jgi:hypothetical protein
MIEQLCQPVAAFGSRFLPINSTPKGVIIISPKASGKMTDTQKEVECCTTQCWTCIARKYFLDNGKIALIPVLALKEATALMALTSMKVTT